MNSQIHIVVNKKEVVNFQIKRPLSIEELKNILIEKFSFPIQSRFQIEIDGVIRDSSYQLPVQFNSRINADFEYLTNVTIKNKNIQTFQYEVNLCKSIIEIQNEIARIILPNEYSVYIVQNQNQINHSYINSSQEVPKMLDIIIQAFIYINHQGMHKQLKINPFDKIDKIKNSINQELGIEQRYQLFYNNIQLCDDIQFHTYSIPNHSEIKINLSNRITFLVKYNDVVHKYSVSIKEKLGVIKTMLKQKYKIPKDQIIQLIYLDKVLEDDQAELQAIGIDDSSLINIRIQKIYNLTLKNKVTDQNFFHTVYSTDQVSILDKCDQLQGRQVAYYYNNKQLYKGETFEQIQAPNLDFTILYQIKQSKIQVKFQDKEKKQRDKLITVNISDPIKNAVIELGQSSFPLCLYYRDTQISMESTYDELEIQDGHTINYKVNKIQIKYTIAPSLEEHTLQAQRFINGAQLLQNLSQLHNRSDQHFKLMLNNFEFPAHQIVVEQEHQCFRLVPTFTMHFIFLNDDQRYQETFLIDDTIKNARQKFSQKFSLSLNSIIILYKDLDLKDDQLLSQYKNKDLWICETILVNIQTSKGNLLKQKNYNKNIQIKEILRNFLIDSSKINGKFFKNNQIVSNSSQLKEITDGKEVTLVIVFELELSLVNKQSKQLSQTIQFYQFQPINQTIPKQFRKKYKLYYKDQLIDKTKTFEENQITNDCQIYYEEIHNYTLEIQQENQQIPISIHSLDTKIKDIVIPTIKERFCEDFTAYYNNRQLDLENTFQQEKINDDGIIQISLNNLLTVKIHIHDHTEIFRVPPNIKIGQLLQQFKGNQYKKLFKISTQEQLQDHILISTLINDENVVELNCKEVVENLISVYIPSEEISNNFNLTQNIKTIDVIQLEISVYDTQTGKEFNEIIRLDQRTGDWLDEFEKKMEYSSTYLFKDGEVVDRTKTFEDIGTQASSKFEICN